VHVLIQKRLDVNDKWLKRKRLDGGRQLVHVLERSGWIWDENWCTFWKRSGWNSMTSCADSEKKWLAVDDNWLKKENSWMGMTGSARFERGTAGLTDVV
jgi:hypothetical protein